MSCDNILNFPPPQFIKVVRIHRALPLSSTRLEKAIFTVIRYESDEDTYFSTRVHIYASINNRIKSLQWSFSWRPSLFQFLSFSFTSPNIPSPASSSRCILLRFCSSCPFSASSKFESISCCFPFFFVFQGCLAQV